MSVEQWRRKLDIGSCRERLETVRELGAVPSREAYELLQVAAGDIDPQVREEARRMMQLSLWYSGSSAVDASSKDEERNHESLF